MKFSNLFGKVDFKIVDQESDIKIIKIKNKIHIFYMESNNNRFYIERDYYEYLDGHNMPYVLLLSDTTVKRYFYIDLNRSYNWVKACFDSCEKDKLFLGKQVLNYGITEDELVLKLSKL